MAAGDKNAVLGGNPTESISAYEDAAADRVAATIQTDEFGVKYTATNPQPVRTGYLAGEGRKTVTTAGTQVAIAGSTACTLVIVQALLPNSQPVTVGTTAVEGATATRTGIALLAGDTLPIAVSNLNQVFVDALVSGDLEGVSFIYFT